MYSITECFSPILYCWPDVATLGNPFDTMKRFCLYSQCSHPKPLDIISSEGGCSEGLDAFRFFLKTTSRNTVSQGIQNIWT